MEALWIYGQNQEAATDRGVPLQSVFQSPQPPPASTGPTQGLSEVQEGYFFFPASFLMVIPHVPS